jgi:hypothetical protein
MKLLANENFNKSKSNKFRQRETQERRQSNDGPTDTKPRQHDGATEATERQDERLLQTIAIA